MTNKLNLYYDSKGAFITINLGDSYQKEIRSLMLFINKNFQKNEDCKTKINNFYDLYKEEIKDKEWEEKHTQKKKYISPLEIGAKKGEVCWEEFISYKIVIDKKREAEAAEKARLDALAKEEAEKLRQQQEAERLQREAEAAEKAKQDAIAKEEAEKLHQQQEAERLQREAEAEAAENARQEALAKEEAERKQQQEAERLQREAEAAAEKARQEALAKEEAEKLDQQQEVHAEQHRESFCNNQGIEVFDEYGIPRGCFIRDLATDSEGGTTLYGKFFHQNGVVYESQIDIGIHNSVNQHE